MFHAILLNKNEDGTNAKCPGCGNSVDDAGNKCATKKAKSEVENEVLNYVNTLGVEALIDLKNKVENHDKVVNLLKERNAELSKLRAEKIEREKLDLVLKELRESEMWQYVKTVRSLRPENQGK
jgi:hypothetical protein